jgi:hypothetical protein
LFRCGHPSLVARRRETAKLRLIDDSQST